MWIKYRKNIKILAHPVAQQHPVKNSVHNNIKNEKRKYYDNLITQLHEKNM